MNDIMLTTDLNEISASILIQENEYTFLFHIPVTDPQTKFNFFEIRQIPIFAQSKIYLADIKHKYIGININTNQYILLTQTEFQRCLVLPICILPSPFNKINEHSQQD